MLCNRLVLCVRLYLGQKDDLIIGLVYYTWILRFFFLKVDLVYYTWILRFFFLKVGLVYYTWILRFLFLKVSRLSWKSTKL